jgi:hypothetical protein
VITSDVGPVLDWDELLDDFEDRIDNMWSLLDDLESITANDADHDTEPDSHSLGYEPFVAPAGAPREPTTAHLDRLAQLHLDLAEAASAIVARKNQLLAENDALHLASRARRRYATSARLGR